MTDDRERRLIEYGVFLTQKQQSARPNGIKRIKLPDMMFGFQRHLTEWALTQGGAVGSGNGRLATLKRYAELA